jgi:2-hydroxy-3-keto-5-methylthiopentenyl-1-phosphate phosphatase
MNVTLSRFTAGQDGYGGAAGVPFSGSTVTNRITVSQQRDVAEASADGAPSPIVIVCDFDGTVTHRDTLRLLAAEYGSDALWSSLRARMRSGELTLDDALERLFARMSVPFAEARDLVLARNPTRAGFRELVCWCREHGHRLLILSNGFRSMIAAILERAGITGVEIISHDARFSSTGCQIIWRRREEPCPACGTHCKRHEFLAGSAAGRRIYIGDGISDHCAAEVADLVFARNGLADHLAQRGLPFEPFEDFHEVLRAFRERAARPQGSRGRPPRR